MKQKVNKNNVSMTFPQPKKAGRKTDFERAKDKSAAIIANARELNALVDAASGLVAASVNRGYCPTIHIKGGVILAVAAYALPEGKRCITERTAKAAQKELDAADRDDVDVEVC